MNDHVKLFTKESDLLDQYDKGDRDLAYWDGPGWYYMTPDYHWRGAFVTMIAAEVERQKSIG